jgi:hypothetical protein
MSGRIGQSGASPCLPRGRRPTVLSAAGGPAWVMVVVGWLAVSSSGSSALRKGPNAGGPSRSAVVPGNHILDDDERDEERQGNDKGDRHHTSSFRPGKLVSAGGRRSSRTASSIRSTALPDLVRQRTCAPLASNVLHVSRSASAIDHGITETRLTSRTSCEQVRPNASRASTKWPRSAAMHGPRTVNRC